MTTSSFSDPLEQPLEPKRVNYENGVMLDAQDFRDEQTYFRGRLGRMLFYLHGYGTVAGLKVAPAETDVHVLQVRPGLAIDRIGRLIELPVPYCIRMKKWFESQDPEELSNSFASSASGGGSQAVVADVFIEFKTCEQGMTPFFGTGNADKTDAFASHRLKDGMALSIHCRCEENKPVPALFPTFLSFDPDNPLTFEEARNAILANKKDHAWLEESIWNEVDSRFTGGPEHLMDRQNGTEVLLARLRIPAAGDPLAYDTNGAIEVDDSIRPLCYTTTELLWIINSTRGNKQWP